MNSLTPVSLSVRVGKFTGTYSPATHGQENRGHFLEWIMKSPRQEINKEMQEAYRRQFDVGEASLQAQTQVKALRLRLLRWHFFCFWAKISLLLGAPWCWSAYRSELRFPGPDSMFIIWLVIGAASILKWTLKIKALEKRASDYNRIGLTQRSPGE